jgi:hypothetical protein
MIKIPMYFGIVVKKSDKSKIAEDSFCDRMARLDEDMRSDKLLIDEDADLMSFCAGMGDQDVLYEKTTLEGLGLQDGIDFFVTSSPQLGRLPDWLEKADMRGFLICKTGSSAS